MSVPASSDYEPIPSPSTFREVMGRYATGAAIVTATLRDEPHGLAVNSLTSVSLDPPLLLFCPDRRSDTWPVIREAGHFAVNILAHGQDQLCRRFARKGTDRFADLTFTRSARGCPILDETIAYLECEIRQVIDAGDHYITIGRVMDMGIDRERAPLVFYQGHFHRLGDEFENAVEVQRKAAGNSRSSNESEVTVEGSGGPNGQAVELTGEQIRAVRKETRAGALDCRKALEANNGDVQRAIDYLREKGIGTPKKVWT
ncbi:flavin reductase [Pseudonocardia hispaniensis]|uniref:Flavin reductase n=1 Tax=Pseudonocardia hispaniensis TaxID=904933 RepID=A0ABW1J907_9PSEU